MKTIEQLIEQANSKISGKSGFYDLDVLKNVIEKGLVPSKIKIDMGGNVFAEVKSDKVCLRKENAVLKEISMADLNDQQREALIVNKAVNVAFHAKSTGDLLED